MRILLDFADVGGYGGAFVLQRRRIWSRHSLPWHADGIGLPGKAVVVQERRIEDGGGRQGRGGGSGDTIFVENVSGELPLSAR